MSRAWEAAILRVDARSGPTLAGYDTPPPGPWGAFLPMAPGEETTDRLDLIAWQATIYESETQAGGRRDERRRASLRASLRRHDGWGDMVLREPLRIELRGAWLALDDVHHRRQSDSAGISAGVSASARRRRGRRRRKRKGPDDVKGRESRRHAGGGIREAEPEEEDAAGADGARHQTEPRQGSRRMMMTQKTTGGGARDGPAMNLDPPVNPPAWAILN